MRFTLSFVFVALLGGLTPPARLFAQPKQLPANLVAPTDALSPADERKAFTVPEGFDVQLVASEPDIQKPMQIAFDAKGRLWVTTSHHYPFAVPQGKGTDKLFILSDFDPETGKAKKVQKFAEDLNIPIGILPLPDCKSCIVSSTGEIRKYTDTDGDGKADKSEVLFTGFGFKDTHGMTNSFTLMPDGWVYACHGFANDSVVKGKDGHEIKMSSGHTFRFKPDGSRIEVWTRGQVNPFGIAVDPWFNLYTADCHSKPITQLVPGAYYESFGKPHDGLGFTPHVTAHPHKSTGLCGLAWYDADHFPKEYKGTMLLGDVVSNCISFDRIVWKGSTPVAVEQPDFLTSKDRWFRPVDIKLGPDGALYVADFYNKIIGHYEVDLKHPGRDKDHGRIWRIVWKGKDGKAPAPKFHRDDFTKATNEELLEDLFHPNLTVRFFAGHQLRQRIVEGKGKDPLANTETAFAKVLKMPDHVSAYVGWLLFIGEADKESVKVDAYSDFLTFAQDPKNGLKPEHVTSHLVRSLSSRPKWEKKERAVLLDIFKSFDAPHLTRAAAEAAGAHPHADFIAPLVAVLKKCPAEDVLLKQAAKIALRNCLAVRPDNLGGVIGKDEKTDILIAESLLGVRPGAVANLKVRAGPDGENGPVVATAILSIHSQQAAGQLVKIMQSRELPSALMPSAADLVGRYAEATGRTTFARQLTKNADLTARNADVLLAMYRGVQAYAAKLTNKEVEEIVSAIDGVLNSTVETSIAVNKDVPGDAAARTHAVLKLVHALPSVVHPESLAGESWAKLAGRLGRIVESPRAPDDLRAASAEAQLVADPKSGYNSLKAAVTDKGTSPALRERLLVVAAGSRVPGAQLDARDALKDVPYRVAVQIATSFASTLSGADILLTAVKQGKAPQRLLQEKAILERLKASNLPGWEKTVADLTKGIPPADQRLADLIKNRTTGFPNAKADKVEGAKLFTKHCAACHKIGDQGGKIAPQLDGIGLRGLERLLEDTLDPNRNVDQAFRARSITTTDDRTITALMLRVDGEVLVVADLEGKEKRIPLKEITLNRETMLSAMPANFGDVVPEADFYHIVAYLLDQKAKDPPKK